MPGIIVKPPIVRYPTNQYSKTVFLAGSIEMDTAEKWQDVAAARLVEGFDIVFNPRRAAWDSSWEQKIDSPEFNAQVHWELDMIMRSDCVVFYFDPNTKSPITLMELGMELGRRNADTTYVCCPEGFWRKGNVDIMCERFGAHTFPTLDALIEAVVSVGRVMQEEL